MLRSRVFRVYPDEIIFDIIILLNAWFILPGILKKTRALPFYIGYDGAFAAMMLFFLVALWYTVPVLKLLADEELGVVTGIGSLLLFIVVIVPLIEGPGLLASHYGVDRHGIEGRFMLTALLMIVLGLAGGNFMTLLEEKVIEKIDDPFVAKMIALGTANAGAAAAAVLFCFYNLVMVAYFLRHARDPLYGYFLSLFLSGLALVRVLMACRPPARPVTIMSGLASIFLYAYLGLIALGLA